MAGLLGNAFIMSDVDGTLLDDEHRISDKNKSAIKELTEAGGLFTLATGRGIAMARPIIEELDLKIPAVIFNGAAIYDCEADKMLWYSDLPSCAEDYVKAICERFPTAAVELLLGDEVYVICTNELEEQHLAMGNVTPVRKGLSDVPKDGRIKSLIVDTPENIDKIAEFIRDNGFSEANWVRSSPIYYEMLPPGVSKGTGLKKLLEIMGEQNRYVVGIGDYMNDTEMLIEADLGVAVGNARPTVKEAADLIVSDNNHNAVYEVIEYIKNTEKDG